MTFEQIKKEVLERAENRVDWGWAGQYGPDQIKASELPKDQQQDLVESVRAYLISENKQFRLHETVRFAETNDLDYATKDQDMIASAEGKLYDCRYLQPFAMVRFYDECVGDEINKNIAILVNAGLPPEQISQVASKAIGIYESTIAKMKDEGDPGLWIVETVLEVAHKTLDQYLD